MPVRARTALILSVAALSGALLAVANPRAAVADRGGSVKFSLTDYKVTKDASLGPTGPISMSLVGRASYYGSEHVEFTWTVPDGRPWLEILSACAMGRVTGTIAATAKVDQDSKGITGEGELGELTCRVILK